MNLFMKNGYVDVEKILDLGLPFNFVVGGRATGKTYTSLKHVYEKKKKFMFMRRTQAQADLINKPDFSPFKSLNTDMGISVESRPITKYNAAFYNGDDETPIGYTCALSTISNIRGFDASDVKIWIYDEFIPESHERPLKNEGMAFLNAYETMNRNRELKGMPPLQVLALANANDISNPIFLELGIVSKVEKAMRKGQNCYIDRERGIGVFLLTGSPISQAKSNTVLYKLAGGGDFRKMSLDNDFVNRDYSNIANRNLAEYSLIVSVGELGIYRHKSSRKLFVSTHKSGTAVTFSSSDYDLQRFSITFGWLWNDYMNGNVEFEEIFCEILFTKYLK